VSTDPKSTYTVEQKRHWVRIADACNQRCLFCLDSDNHIGVLHTDEHVEADFALGRKRGCERLIISGGEASIHPRFHYFIRRGIEMGYEKVQTVTNGRMWAYPIFVKKAVKAGLSEVTFSMHGHNAKLHDRLVGVPGAFNQAVKGLKHCLSIPGLIVSVDIVLMEPNIRVLPEIIRFYSDMGVGEYDLLAMIPFGRGAPNPLPESVGMTRPVDAKMAMRLLLSDGQIAKVMPQVVQLQRERGLTIWTNRVKPQELEGCEYLLQRPKKLTDEVYGAKKEFQGALAEPQGWLPCDDRCQWCFLDQMCQGFKGHRDEHYANDITHGWWRAEWGDIPTYVPFEQLTLEGGTLDELVAACTKAGIDSEQDMDLVVEVMASVDAVTAVADTFPQARIVTAKPVVAELVSNLGLTPLAVQLTETTLDWFVQSPRPGTVFVPKPKYSKVKFSEALPLLAQHGAIFQGFPPCLPPEGAMSTEDRPGPYPLGVDQFEDTIHGTSGWNLERFVQAHLRSHYVVHSLRCGDCSKRATCPGLHVDYVRDGFGLSELDPTRFPKPKATAPVQQPVT